eukprot:scaffold200406_cov32-Tisochrysis_lutea.AAC.4
MRGQCDRVGKRLGPEKEGARAALEKRFSRAVDVDREQPGAARAATCKDIGPVLDHHWPVAVCRLVKDVPFEAFGAHKLLVGGPTGGRERRVERLDARLACEPAPLYPARDKVGRL